LFAWYERGVALPKHPSAGLARRQLVVAVLFLLGAGLFFAAGGVAAGVATAIFGVFMGWSGIVLGRSGRAVLLNNLAYERLSRGHVEEAEALLAQIQARDARKGSVARALATQRAMIALYRGDAERAVAEATRGLDAPPGLFGGDHQKAQDAAALALRALANASLGRDAESRADADRAEKAELTTPEALARAGLARALIVSRTEGAAGLAAIFVVGGGARLIEYLSPRERVLARALRRMARARRPHAYRDAAKRDEVGEAKEVASWVAKLAPVAAEYATEAYAKTGDVETHVEPTAEASAEVARSRKKAARSMGSEAKRTLGLWLALVVMFGAFWTLFSQPSRAPHVPHAPHVNVTELVQPWYLSWWAASTLMVLLIASVIAWQLRKQRRISRALIQMRLDVARGEEARAEASLGALAKSVFDSVAGNAWLGLAQIAERRADFEKCIAACDSGLSRLARTASTRAMQSDIALPELVATRAFALAAQGRRDESDAERARLGVDYPSYPYAGRAHLRVSLAAAVRAGDLEAAAKIARTRSADMPLTLRDDLLIDVVLAVVDGASTEELERIEGELRDDEKVRAWVDAVAPGLRDRMRGRARVRVGEGDRVGEEEGVELGEGQEEDGVAGVLRGKVIAEPA
jgi:hypothetical protein